MKKKCYTKCADYVIPEIYCNFCRERIEPGEMLYTVAVKWGNSKSACEKCYDEFEETN